MGCIKDSILVDCYRMYNSLKKCTCQECENVSDKDLLFTTHIYIR